MRHYFYLNKTEISCWLWMFSALSLCFISFMFQFIWGNHDWLPLLDDLKLTSGLIEGRFSQYLIINIFLSGKILPILNILLGFFFYTLSLTLLCSRFFNFTLTKPSDKLFLITIATLPYIIEILYFHFITLSLLCWPFIIVLSLIAAKHALTQHPYLNIALSSILLFIAIGGYPTTSGMYATIACLYIMQTLEQSPNFKTLFRQTIPFTLSFVLAFLPIPLIYHLLKQNNLMIELYNSRPETLIGLLQKLPSTLCLSIKSLFQPQPFFPLSFKIITTALIFYFLCTFFHQCHKKKKLFIGIILTLTLFITLKLPAWLIKETAESYFAAKDPAAFMVRSDFYTIPSLLLFCFFFLKKQPALWKRNLLFSLALSLLYININANYSFAKTQSLGFITETKLLERITARIQAHTDFQTNQIYHITQLGDYSSRTKYYPLTPLQKYGYYTLTTPYTRYWLATEHFNFYAPAPFAANQIGINKEATTPQLINLINDPTAIWPSEKAIYLNNESQLAVISLTSKGKSVLTKQFNHINEQNR